MKKVEISETVFKKLLDGVKSAVSNDDSRPILRFIMLEIKKDSITAYSCNGWRAGKVQVEQKNEEEFTCYFKPFSFKANKQGYFNVLVEYDEENTYITTKTEFGEMRYCFKQPRGNYIDIARIFDNAREHDREIAVNSVWLTQAVKAIDATQLDRNHCVIIQSNPDNIRAFIVKGRDNKIVNEQLILPIRLFFDKE